MPLAPTSTWSTVAGRALSSAETAICSTVPATAPRVLCGDADPRRACRALPPRAAPGALAGDGRDGGSRGARRRADRALGDGPLPGHALPGARPGGARGGNGDRLLDAAHGRAAHGRARDHAGGRR